MQWKKQVHGWARAPDCVVKKVRFFERIAQVVEGTAVQWIESDDVHIHLLKYERRRRGLQKQKEQQQRDLH